MVIQYLAVAERFEDLLEKDEQMDLLANLFPRSLVYADVIIMTGSLPGNIPLEIWVPVEKELIQVKVKTTGINSS
ncbi:hypothetical protein WQ54_29985 [Bacillus sp. SA1-12]|uniref:hypothetical protein n=1 Tax=Bacillus sp. SA1-12 TaxID=1455638 RepID=UPI000627057A|nr:hypothetical protein [Bacillus sp. SA1-12]KKI88742.1 hypothetical protein WQ54_29985 [Bacillus sp. SA1-12]